MKRKVFDEQHFYCPFTKSRRLDGELFSDMQIEQTVEAPLIDQVLLSQHFAMDDSVAEPVHVDDSVEDRALVLYDAAIPLFVKSPRTPELCFTVHSDLVPGLKDYFHTWGSSFSAKEASTEERNIESNNHLAVVPWAPIQHPLVAEVETPTGDASEPMDAEGAEMMEIEDDTTTTSGMRSSEFHGPVRGTGGLQPWMQLQQQQKQYSLNSQLFQNSNMPVR